MSNNVELQGFAEVQAAIARLTNLAPVKAALRAGAVHLKGKIAQYPPATGANMPGPYPARWYERGYGPRWARKIKKGVGGRRTSENLATGWTVEARDDGLTQVVGNDTTYGPYVQGDEQAACHAAHGWKTVDQVLEQESETILKAVSDAIDKALAGG